MRTHTFLHEARVWVSEWVSHKQERKERAKRIEYSEWRNDQESVEGPNGVTTESEVKREQEESEDERRQSVVVYLSFLLLLVTPFPLASVCRDMRVGAQRGCPTIGIQKMIQQWIIEGFYEERETRGRLSVAYRFSAPFISYSPPSSVPSLQLQSKHSVFSLQHYDSYDSSFRSPKRKYKKNIYLTKEGERSFSRVSLVPTGYGSRCRNADREVSHQ